MSINTMSGVNSRVRATASSPSAAWATTSILLCSRIIAKPARTNSWSSAITTRIMRPLPRSAARHAR
jgi:hypothetical protein